MKCSKLLMVVVFLFFMNGMRLGAQPMPTSTLSGIDINVNGQVEKNCSEKEFPTHKLKYAVPNDWKISEDFLESKSTTNWWVPQYQISIASPDTHVNTNWPLPEWGYSSVPGAEIVIISYGSNNASSAEEWYQSRLNKLFPQVANYSAIEYEDGPSARYAKAKFAEQDAYCASFGDRKQAFLENSLPGYSSCFILFGNLIYAISTKTNDQAPNYIDDVNKLKLILRSMKFID